MITKEQWKDIEKTLQSFFGYVEIKADGYKISLRLLRISTYNNAIMVYVEDTFKPNWLADDCEERKRFCKAQTRSLLTGKALTQFKQLSKKHQKEIRESKKYEYTFYTPYWKSFRGLKKHLLANNVELELICCKIA